MPTTYDALLIVSFGGPEGPDDVIPFLENVLRGRNVPRERMLEVAEHYQHFGGVSPINSQIRELIAALRKQGHPIQYLNMGGGFGIHYRKQEALPAHAFAEVILPVVRETKCRLVLEPGRFIVGNAGLLLSRVIFTKESGGKHGGPSPRNVHCSERVCSSKSMKSCFSSKTSRGDCPRKSSRA